MEIKIATFQKGTPAQEFLPLITDAHNLRYSYAEKNCLYFQIFRFPYKEMTKAVAGHEDGTVKFMKSYIRAAEKLGEERRRFLDLFRIVRRLVNAVCGGYVNRDLAGELQAIFQNCVIDSHFCVPLYVFLLGAGVPFYRPRYYLQTGFLCC